MSSGLDVRADLWQSAEMRGVCLRQLFKPTENLMSQRSNLPPGPGPGRPKGASNRINAEAKQVIAEAAQKLGGVERLVAWAKEDMKNERMFWGSIYPKLVPVQLAGDGDNPLNVVTRVELVSVAPRVDG